MREWEKDHLTQRLEDQASLNLRWTITVTRRQIHTKSLFC